MQLTKLSNKSINEIFELERSKKKFGLTNIKKFLKHLSNPEQSLKVIHVAGTNGKGSVSAMLSSCLIEAGYKVGMFTSPHLKKLNERFRINNKPISDKELDRLTKKINQLQKKYKIDLSFFETITTIAFLYFNEKKVDYAVLETGMGGRLDATNTTSPVLSVITNVSLDHKEILGNTVRKIAKEKAGIIKTVPVITSAANPALDVIRQTCKKNHAKLIIAKKRTLKTNLKGAYQQINASTAYAALKQLKIPESKIRSGLKKVQWHGRFEFLKNNILIDAAHNQDGIAALVKSIKQLKYKNLILILGLMQDKDAKAIIKTLKPLKPIPIITKANVSKAAAPDDIAKHLKEYIIIPNLKQAISYAKSIAAKKDLILITGSIYLIGEVKIKKSISV
ncbi:bifunctional folylpolyglutamate synthase/dihydrofolate synthase [Candidatus Woesearchaeota archaeon]|nr:bifunctional folylpolyglutamate synthase/dihydrofolate synthase [Candidatus Woesearchaeota archaeon]